MKLYMFRTVPLSIVRTYSLYTQLWYMSYRFVDSFRAATGSGWNWVPYWSCSQAVYKPVWYTPLLSVQWITLYDGQRNCPKHVEFHFQKKKIEKLLHLVGFIIRKFITMHSHLNVNVCLRSTTKVGQHLSFSTRLHCVVLGKRDNFVLLRLSIKHADSLQTQKSATEDFVLLRHGDA
jgi:hypothetical protein